MAEQITKKHRHQVIILCRRNVTDLGAIASVQQIMVAKGTMAEILVMAPKSVTFQ